LTAITADVLQVHRDVTHRDLVQLLLHVGEDDDGLGAGAGFIQELGALHQPAADIRIAALLHAADEPLGGIAERALLRVGLRGPAVEGRFRHDVLLAEAAALDARHRERIARLQRAQQVVDDHLGLPGLQRIGARGIHQHVHRLGMAARVAARGQPEDQKQCKVSDHDGLRLTHLVHRIVEVDVHLAASRACSS
jgi:hypothetical protein